ncbi:MAG: nucleoside deaminase [Planctomycetota bacterium]|jgi:cytosine deaminase
MAVLTGVDRALLDAALGAARESLSQGGIPIGAALGTSDGELVSTGHNLRVQTGDTTAHAETACMRNAGRRRDWHTLIMATTLSPCVMCCGAALLHRIPRLVIGEHETFMGDEELLRSRGVELVVADDRECVEMMRSFIDANPSLWNEDIGIPEA